MRASRTMSPCRLVWPPHVWPSASPAGRDSISTCSAGMGSSRSGVPRFTLGDPGYFPQGAVRNPGPGPWPPRGPTGLPALDPQPAGNRPRLAARAATSASRNGPATGDPPQRSARVPHPHRPRPRRPRGTARAAHLDRVDPCELTTVPREECTARDPGREVAAPDTSSESASRRTPRRTASRRDPCRRRRHVARGDPASRPCAAEAWGAGLVGTDLAVRHDRPPASPSAAAPASSRRAHRRPRSCPSVRTRTASRGLTAGRPGRRTADRTGCPRSRAGLRQRHSTDEARDDSSTTRCTAAYRALREHVATVRSPSTSSRVDDPTTCAYGTSIARSAVPGPAEDRQPLRAERDRWSYRSMSGFDRVA